MVYHCLFVALCFVFDAILAALFPGNYLMQTFSFIPALGFCSIVLTVRKFDMINGILFSFSLEWYMIFVLRILFFCMHVLLRL